LAWRCLLQQLWQMLWECCLQMLLLVLLQL
jgi:hypothetical protein